MCCSPEITRGNSYISNLTIGAVGQLAGITLRKPVATDGAAVHALVAECPPLDSNSIYCNLLQCTHFADTSAAAFAGTELLGFVSGYRSPQQQHTLFIWQIAVRRNARGRGLARRMILSILQRPEHTDISGLETSITPGNGASRAVFRSLADSLGATCEESPWFERARHFLNSHDDEMLLRLAPLHLSPQEQRR